MMMRFDPSLTEKQMVEINHDYDRHYSVKGIMMKKLFQIVLAFGALNAFGAFGTATPLPEVKVDQSAFNQFLEKLPEVFGISIGDPLTNAEVSKLERNKKGNDLYFVRRIEKPSYCMSCYAYVTHEPLQQYYISGFQAKADRTKCTEEKLIASLCKLAGASVDETAVKCGVELCDMERKISIKVENSRGCYYLVTMKCDDVAKCLTEEDEKIEKELVAKLEREEKENARQLEERNKERKRKEAAERAEQAKRDAQALADKQKKIEEAKKIKAEQERLANERLQREIEKLEKAAAAKKSSDAVLGVVTQVNTINLNDVVRELDQNTFVKKWNALKVQQDFNARYKGKQVEWEGVVCEIGKADEILGYIDTSFKSPELDHVYLRVRFDTKYAKTLSEYQEGGKMKFSGTIKEYQIHRSQVNIFDNTWVNSFEITLKDAKPL